jgi:hypothetical protein
MVQGEAGAALVRTLLLLVDGVQIRVLERLLGGAQIQVQRHRVDGVIMRVLLRVVVGEARPMLLEVGGVQLSRPVVGTSDILAYDYRRYPLVVIQTLSLILQAKLIINDITKKIMYWGHPFSRCRATKSVHDHQWED